MKTTEKWKKETKDLVVFLPPQDEDMLCEAVVAQTSVIASIAVNGLLVSFGFVGLLLLRRSKSRGGGERGEEMVREPEIELKGVKSGLV